MLLLAVRFTLAFWEEVSRNQLRLFSIRDYSVHITVSGIHPVVKNIFKLTLRIGWPLLYPTFPWLFLPSQTCGVCNSISCSPHPTLPPVLLSGPGDCKVSPEAKAPKYPQESQKFQKWPAVEFCSGLEGQPWKKKKLRIIAKWLNLPCLKEETLPVDAGYVKLSLKSPPVLITPPPHPVIGPSTCKKKYILL